MQTFCKISYYRHFWTFSKEILSSGICSKPNSVMSLVHEKVATTRHRVQQGEIFVLFDIRPNIRGACVGHHARNNCRKGKIGWNSIFISTTGTQAFCIEVLAHELSGYLEHLNTWSWTLEHLSIWSVWALEQLKCWHVWNRLICLHAHSTKSTCFYFCI